MNISNSVKAPMKPQGQVFDYKVFEKMKIQRYLHYYDFKFYQKTVFICIGIFEFVTADFVYNAILQMMDLKEWTIINSPIFPKSIPDIRSCGGRFIHFLPQAISSYKNIFVKEYPDWELH